MKSKLIFIVYFLCKFAILNAQNEKLNLRLELTTFLFKLSKKENSDSIYQYIIEFKSNKKGKIKKCSFYRFENGLFIKEVSNEFNGYKLDSLYSITTTEKQERVFKVGFPVIIKQTYYREYSKESQLFSISEFECMYKLIKFAQSKSKKIILLNPLILLKMPDEF